MEKIIWSISVAFIVKFILWIYYYWRKLFGNS